MKVKKNKPIIYYVIIFIIAIVCLISNKEDRSRVSTETGENMSDSTALLGDYGEDNSDDYGYVRFIDAGQGDCTLIEVDGKFVLIDASTESYSNKVVSYLEQMGVEELEYVFFTHPHEDHIGGGDEVIENFIVKNVCMNDKTENTSCYRNLIETIAQSKMDNGTKVIKPNTGDVFNVGNAEFLIISDGRNYYDNTNNSSICIRMDYGKSTFLFTGDAEKKVENDLLEGPFSLDAEVYKCAHHGSSTSNSDNFLDAINPDISIISCGEDNEYGHPHAEIISALDERNIISRRTDLDGNVVLKFNEEQIILM